ncbi:MAG TPA: T9SS type A sorting domain-containing protein, partial [Flavobacterium sp.]
QSNQITTLTFGGNHSLLGLNCGWNLIETLDVTQTNVMQLNCGNNPSLTQIFMKNGIDTPEIYGSFPAPPIPGFYATETPLLEFICADDNEIDAIIANLNGQMVSVTSYCTFIPGGTFNTIAGTITYGCGSANISVPNTAINVNDGTNLGITYSSDSGEYMFYPGPGNHVISLQMPNASYFTVSPATYTFNLTSTGNSESANFCLSANGVHPDLEITLLPLNAARPGFDADYKIIFSNNGTEVQSGNILLTFDDAVLDFISANPAVSNQGVNSLSWDFVNLMPFETREISFILNVNAPTETPPINNGDTLSFACSVNTTFTDETPADNVDSLVQTVVGSFDPNDKTVLEGSQISTSQIGDYLHYVVRFQNTGTAPATNVVIQDRLAANLDLSTLELISASHPFRSSLTDENNLEFFFDGINLPASIDDEPGSHGYVAFKIKPVTSLVVGDVIENTANIYFDFNFPVVTNTVSTTVTSLGLVESEKDTVSLYPNPATSNIRFSMPINSEFSVVIYNMLGQRVQSAKIDESRTLDVSGLETGTYLVEIKSSTSTFNKKLIKI